MTRFAPTRCVACLLFLGFLPMTAPLVFAQAYDVLGECSKGSAELDAVHACLDDYLDLMDDNIGDLTGFIERTLDGDSLAGFKRSQQAFVAYRRENCLWYLEFSTPRSVAEQIAKNCLASMSQLRLAELQQLLAEDGGTSASLRGSYVYGPERNSFQPCGSASRYWVEGDNVMVSNLQQQYLSAATDDLQLMSVTLNGTLDDEAQTAAGHAGVLALTGVVELRVPKESDCRLPGGSQQFAASGPVAVKPPAAVVPVAEPVAAPEPAADDSVEEPEQQLIAYFGAWLADCVEDKGTRSCTLGVDFASNDVDSPNPPARLELKRRSGQRTTLQLQFPDIEVDSTEKIRWGVDGYVFGDIVGSAIRVDAVGTRQLIKERRFITEDLLPLMVDGGELTVDVLADVDDRRGARQAATLKGLTRALAFADDFVRDGV